MKQSRRRFIGTAIAGTVLKMATTLHARDEVAGRAAQLINPATDRAIERGLAFLADSQEDDGTFGLNGYRRNAGVVALSGLAFVAAGSTPGRGRFSTPVERCLAFLLHQCQANGFVFVDSAQDQRPMYGHGFATMLMAELYGMSKQTDLRQKLSKAVRLIIASQNMEGGWRYQPEAQNADISVTVCQVMALRAAHNAGIHVPSRTIDRCIEYIKNSQNPDGGFSYLLSSPGPSAFERSAAGVVALYSAGVYEGEELDRGVAYLDQFRPHKSNRDATSHFYYGHYYAAQAMWQKGGNEWRTWYPAIRDELLRRQQKNGSWPSPICPEYGTAMAALILQIPNNYLPIFQR